MYRQQIDTRAAKTLTVSGISLDICAFSTCTSLQTANSLNCQRKAKIRSANAIAAKLADRTYQVTAASSKSQASGASVYPVNSA